jgi:hypothetical protein
MAGALDWGEESEGAVPGDGPSDPDVRYSTGLTPVTLIIHPIARNMLLQRESK